MSDEREGLAVSDPKIYDAKREKEKVVIDPNVRDEEVSFIMFDTAAGNLATDEKVKIDDDNLLESQNNMHLSKIIELLLFLN